MIYHFSSAQSRRGSVLMVTILVLMILMALAVRLSERLISYNSLHDTRAATTKQIYAAESALNLGMSVLKDDLSSMAIGDVQTFNVSPADTPTYDLDFANDGTPMVNDHEIYIEVERIADRRFTFRSQASRYGPASDPTRPGEYSRHVVEAMVIQQDLQVGNIGGAFSMLGYTFKGSADAYYFDSDPSYISSVEASGDSPTLLGSAGDLLVTTSGTVDGQAIGNVAIDKPEVKWNPPAGAFNAGPDFGTWNVGNLSHDGGSVFLGSNDYLATEWLTGSVQLAGSSTVTLWLDGPIDLKNIAINVPAGSRLVVVQNDFTDTGGQNDMQMKATGGVDFGHASDPARFVFLSAFDGEVKFGGNANIAGIFMMPDVQLQWRGNSTLYGSIFVNSMKSNMTTGNPKLQYDTNASDLLFDQVDVFATVGWRSYALNYGADNLWD